MELEWDSRPVLHHPRDWHDRSQPAAGPSNSAPSAFIQTSPSLSTRRRSSAAHTRPAGPPPNLPIPSIPDLSPDHSVPQPPFPGSLPDPPAEDPYHSHVHANGSIRGSRSSSFARQGASPNLAAVAAFSQSRLASSQQISQLPAAVAIDDLSDPPPQSILPPSSSRIYNPPPPQETEQRLMPPPDSRSSEGRTPSSRRTLTRALELAREAVQLDSTNDNPEAAVHAYGRSVALLSEVMERVKRGEDSTEAPRKRNGRRRSVVAQEEEVRRLQNIHDTYADRMNILSIIYSIPAIPYSTSSVYSSLTASTTDSQSGSPTNSASPSSDTPGHIPESLYTTNDTPDDLHNIMDSEDETQDGMAAIGAAMFMGGLPSPVKPAISGLPPPSSHPYAAAFQYEIEVTQPPVNRVSVQPRRSRGTSAALPPALPPPLSSPPPAPAVPATGEPSIEPSLAHRQSHLEVATRQRGDSVGHKRTGSGSRLAALEEEAERYEGGPAESEEQAPEYFGDAALKRVSRHLVQEARNQRHDSPPLPALPSPSSVIPGSPGTPRNGIPVNYKLPPSPRMSHIVVPRPRGSSQLSARSETLQMINVSTNQGTIYKRRSKTSAPPTPRSTSPAESTASTSSIPLPKSAASSLPGSSAASVIGAGRTRSSSQPGRRPSLVGGRISPSEQRPPLPSSAGINGAPPQRKTSIPSKLNPYAQQLQLTVQTDITPIAGNTLSLTLPPPTIYGGLPTTPTSPLPPIAPSDPLRKPYHLMNLLRTTMTSPSGGYITRRLHVPQEVWSQGGAKLANLIEKIRVVGILCSALEELQTSSSEYFGAGNVSSGMALGIGSVGRKEGEAWLARLEDFSTVCDGVVANFGKKLGVGEGFVLKKTTWGDKLGRRFDKFTNGKNLDSPAAYVQGLRKLFLHAQLLDEHTKAVSSQPVAPAYTSFPADIRSAADIKLRRSSEFFASVVLTFVIRDLSQLLDKYAKKCEKWLAE